MTCIAVLRKKNGKLIMAGDRRMSWGMMKHQVKVTPKVHKRNGLLIGGTGTCYIIELAHTILKVRPPNKKEDPVIYINNVFLEEFKKLLMNKGFKKDGNIHLTNSFRTILIIAIKSKLFELEVDVDNDKNFSFIIVDQIEAPYAHGCGGYYALGSLLTTENMRMPEEERLTIALQVAAKMSPGCDDNIDILEE